VEGVLMVKCKECGLLAVIHPQTNEAVEAPSKLREDGYFVVDRKWFFPSLVCRANVRLFDKGKRWESGQELLDAISDEIECTSFCDYELGRTPKEFEEMSLHQQMIRWEQQQEAIAETRHQELRRDAQRRHWQTIAISILCAIIASGVFAALFRGSQ
jgi:hypothetical protein